MIGAFEAETNHRFTAQLKKGRDAGNVQFILHGESLSNDWYNNGYVLGTHGFRKSLVMQLLFPAGLNWVQKVVVLSNRDIALYEMKSDKLRKNEFSNFHQLSAAIKGEKTEEFKPSPLSAKSSAATDTGQGPPEDTPEHEEENHSALSLYNCFAGITEIFEDTEIQSLAVIVENLAWIAELFPNRNHRLEYLEEIEKWGSVSAQSRHLSFISLPTLDEFGTYLSHIKPEAENCVFITGPSVNELQSTLGEFYRLRKENLPSLPDIYDWDSIATALKLKGYSLLQSIHFLDSFSRDITDDTDTTTAEIFNTIFKKRLGVSIEEVSWEKDVILPTETKESIGKIFEKFKASETNEIPKGLLLHGPPGTGKTHIAKGLASKGGCYFLPLKLADIKGEFIGHSGRNVQRIFLEARASAPTLIFIDEIDTIFGSRGGSDQDSFANDIVNQFLAETDGVDTSGQPVFIIGATNRLELVDQAVKSRLEPVNIGLPDEDNRRELLRKHLDRNFDTEELNKLVEKSTGLSGRDLKSLANAIKGLKDGKQVSDGQAADSALEVMRKNVKESLDGDSFSIELAKRTAGSEDVLSQVIGYQNLCRQLNQAVLMVRKGSKENIKISAAEIEAPNGILLHGPYGNGKTFLVESLAKHHKMDYVLVSGNNLNAGFVDGTIRQLDQIIDNTIRMSVMGPVLLFFDEFDALASERELSLKLRGALLNGINRLRKYPNILLMAATNFYDLLSEAVIRPGRFDSHLFMGNPEADTIVELIQRFCESSNNFILRLSDKNLTQLAEELARKKVSIAEVKVLCKGAQQQAVLSGERSPFIIDLKQLQFARCQIRKSAV